MAAVAISRALHLNSPCLGPGHSSEKNSTELSKNVVQGCRMKASIGKHRNFTVCMGAKSSRLDTPALQPSICMFQKWKPDETGSKLFGEGMSLNSAPFRTLHSPAECL